MEDKYLWLEEIQSIDAIDWVKIKNNESVQKLRKHPWFSEIECNALKIFSSVDKIPYVTIDGEYVYNLWNDEVHIQGIYRRTKIEDYLKSIPSWEMLLDLDELSQKENVKWVFKNFQLNRESTRALVFLSPGGSDADIMREFDMHKKEFVANGFNLPEAKGSAHWVDKNTLSVARTHGENAETDSGYARTIREWKRGTSFDSANVIYEINKSECITYSKDVRTISETSFFLGRGIDFYNVEEMIFQNGEWIKLNLPPMAEVFNIVEGHYIVMIKEDWNQFKTGDVIAYDLNSHECKKIFSVNNNE